MALDAVCGRNVGGRYEGINHATYKSGGEGDQNIVISVEQTGNNLKVSFEAAAGGAGKGTGTFVDGGVASMTLESTAPDCPGSYDASFKFADNAVSWSFKGHDCGGDMEGHGTAKKAHL